MLQAIGSKLLPVAVAVGLEARFTSSADNNQRLFGLVIFSNVIVSSFTLIHLGMKVGKARKELNVPLPTMYATEDTPEAKKFNCVQRGHQQALETFPSFLALSLVSGARFPVTTSAMGLLYALARLKWAEHYSEMGADSRYASWLARQVWTPLVVLAVTASLFAGELLSGAPLGLDAFVRGRY